MNENDPKGIIPDDLFESCSHIFGDDGLGLTLSSPGSFPLQQQSDEASASAMTAKLFHQDPPHQQQQQDDMAELERLDQNMMLFMGEGNIGDGVEHLHDMVHLFGDEDEDQRKKNPDNNNNHGSGQHHDSSFSDLYILSPAMKRRRIMGSDEQDEQEETDTTTTPSLTSTQTQGNTFDSPFTNSNDLLHLPEEKNLSTSDQTRRRFNLEQMDIDRNTDPEISQSSFINNNISNDEDDDDDDDDGIYVSPYPKPKPERKRSPISAPLGYFPSSYAATVQTNRPSTGRRGINTTMNDLNNNNKDRKICTDLAMMMMTKSTKKPSPPPPPPTDAELRRQNAALRRGSTTHQRKIEQVRKETEDWKRRFSSLAATYNGLVSTYNGLLSWVGQQEHDLREIRESEFNRGVEYGKQQQQQQQQPGLEASSSKTIDLTSDNDVDAGARISTTTRGELLRNMRKKTYDWMEKRRVDANTTTTTTTTTRAEDELIQMMETELTRGN